MFLIRSKCPLPATGLEAFFLPCGSRHGRLANARSPRKRPKLLVCAGRLRQRSRQGQVYLCFTACIFFLHSRKSSSASLCRVAASAPASDPCDGCAGQTGGLRTNCELDVRGVQSLPNQTNPSQQEEQRSMEAPLDPGISLLSDDSNPACHGLNLQMPPTVLGKPALQQQLLCSFNSTGSCSGCPAADVEAWRQHATCK